MAGSSGLGRNFLLAVVFDLFRWLLETTGLWELKISSPCFAGLSSEQSFRVFEAGWFWFSIEPSSGNEPTFWQSCSTATGFDPSNELSKKLLGISTVSVLSSSCELARILEFHKSATSGLVPEFPVAASDPRVWLAWRPFSVGALPDKTEVSTFLLFELDDHPFLRPRFLRFGPGFSGTWELRTMSPLARPSEKISVESKMFEVSGPGLWSLVGRRRRRRLGCSWLRPRTTWREF